MCGTKSNYKVIYISNTTFEVIFYFYFLVVLGWQRIRQTDLFRLAVQFYARTR